MESTQLLEAIVAATSAIKEGNQLSQLKIAEILRKISECELEEGGPYALLGECEPDLELNQRIVEFLELFDARLPNVDTYLRKETENATTPHIRRIRELARKRFAALPNEMAKRALVVIDKTIARDADTQITSMTQYMRDSLGLRGKLFSDENIAKLSFENVLFWSAITMYDDFWDEDEDADPRLLPIANLFAREYSDFYTHFFHEDSGFRAFFQNSMDLLDQANAWETSSCRMRVAHGVVTIPTELPEFGSYENKFYPAIGQVFGPIAMLLGLGYSIDSKEVTALLEYFKHYLIAMQINDDLHDWKEDLANGHITTVTGPLLAEWRVENEHSQRIYLNHDVSELEQLFWYKVLIPFCNCILDHCDQSRIALRNVGLFENTSTLEGFIARSERAAREALIEHARTAEFIAALQ